MAALSFIAARPGAKPLEPFGKGSNALKAGTLDAGPRGPAAPDDRRTFGRKADNSFPGTCAPAQPSVQPPAGVERKRAIYADRRETQAHGLPGAVVVERRAAQALPTRLGGVADTLKRGGASGVVVGLAPCRGVSVNKLPP